MRRDRNALHRLTAMSSLQGLREQASRADLTQASIAHHEAREALSLREAELNKQTGAIDMLMAAPSLDFDQWRIGLAVLSELDMVRNTAADHARASEEEETARRAQWHREDAAKRHLTGLGRTLARRLANKADEVRSLDALTLQLSLREVAKG